MGKVWFFLILLYLIPSFNDIYNLRFYLKGQILQNIEGFVI
jgi:hypothetical protein